MPTPKGRILCSEDDADTRDMIVLLLNQYDYEAICAESAEAALEIAKTQPFDLFLVDSWMPGASGTELCEALRKFDQETPILFYSGAAYESDKEAARLAGAQGYVVKPAVGEELINEVVRIIAESKIVKPVQVAAL
ncbi:MAG: two-component system, OmpR family, response regulator [Blastocatellia bacterium]|jgi:DNA-binding response OmpR family regulator|nr:two-component system, OmpR family, response regulator [Blastocatellia bacterium]